MQVVASLVGLSFCLAPVANPKQSAKVLQTCKHAKMAETDDAPTACVCKLHWSERAADKQQKKQVWWIRDQCLGTLPSHSPGDTAEAAQAVSAEERQSAEGHPYVWMGTGSPLPSRSLLLLRYVKQAQMAKLLQMMVNLKAIRRTANTNSICQCRMVEEPLVISFGTHGPAAALHVAVPVVDSSVFCAEVQIVLYIWFSLYCMTCMTLLQSRITLQFCRQVCTSFEVIVSSRK